MNDPLHEEQESSEAVFDGRLLKVFRDGVRLPDGSAGVREYVKHPGAVVVIPVCEDGLLIFERQFRYPLGRAFLELPAGKIDAGEDILACARRELQEETGYEGEHWRHLGVMHPCIGYSDERIEIFLATGLTHVGHALDEGEFLEIVHMSLVAARAAVFDGRITDAKTITALFWAERELAVG
ncbi:MAG: NUDIX hydrolase [Zoogloea oleivorans]|jgi:ADP-ribose pyrophosphatase|uniref:NUDIX hydrolase n=1 Tax=Zoogloea oleivorans TaxID=1552750 RepID=UPI002A36CCE5|nr:NUDIX hydrolase [Zoogloea oleivorans]MDY0035230.1 NUDIX hydrolase [Zoogloea oleivorans]